MRGKADSGGPTDDYGHEFVKVGAPGNRAALPEERYYNQEFENLGRVNYRYRIAKTEVTASQWVEFANAYDPYWIASGHTRFDSGFYSEWISPGSYDPTQPANCTVDEGAEDNGVRTWWRLAARYCNWLHNGKVNEAWAFETGAYDTSTFGGNPQDGFTDQAERSPGAKFWIPSVDEWVKAAHYDPDRYGEGIEGYWLRMGGQNEPLTPGLPQNGGETSAGNFLPGSAEQDLPVGLYPDVTSPWGLLDTSGSLQEWTESVTAIRDDGVHHSGNRFALGSRAGESQYADYDLIDWYFTRGGPETSVFGIRLASAIPAPGAAALLIFSAALGGTRRAREETHGYRNQC